MLFLVLAVLCNLTIAVCFKLYNRYGVQPFAAIVFNYWTSFVLGSLIAGHIPILTYTPGSAPWTVYGVVIAVIFVGSFTVAAYSVRYAGMAVTIAMQRMSLLISAGYAILFFGEPLGMLKTGGIVAALFAIVMITYRPKSTQAVSSWIYLLLPVCTLVTSGVIEALLYHIHAHKLAVHGDIVFTTYAFSAAACVGSLVLFWRRIKGSYRFAWKDVFGGVALGVPNFFTIFLILTMLERGMPGSVLYPVLNILVLAATAVVGMFVFREHLQRINIIGLLVALIAIALISLGS